MKLRRNTLSPMTWTLSPRSKELLNFNPVRWRATLRTLEDRRQRYLSVSGPFAALVERPGAVLETYTRLRDASGIGHLLHHVQLMQRDLDRVVIVGTESSLALPRAILDAGNQPFWNELSRAERGSKPRLWWLDHPDDNDTLSGLRLALESQQPTSLLHDHRSWGVLALFDAEDWPCVAPALHTLLPQLPALEIATGSGSFPSSAGTSGRGGSSCRPGSIVLSYPPRSDGEAPPSWSRLPHNLDGLTELDLSWDVFGLASLFPATLVGMNIMELLHGGSWMSKHFLTSPSEENLVLQFVAFATEGARTYPNGTRWMAWHPALARMLQWMERIGMLPLSHEEQMCLPLEADGGCPEAADTCQPGSSSSPFWISDLRVSHPRFDPLPGLETQNQSMSHATGEGSSWEGSGSPYLDDRRLGTFPERIRRRQDEWSRALESRGTPLGSFSLQALDELSIGQWIQFCVLAQAMLTDPWRSAPDRGNRRE